nr:MAG TPA: hypothetical protein [Caudoviricetes sp.]
MHFYSSIYIGYPTHLYHLLNSILSHSTSFLNN